MVPVLPVPEISSVFWMASREARVRPREAHADAVGAIVDHHGRRGGLALQHGAGIEFHFLRGEAGARGRGRIDAEYRGRSADGVFDSVEHVHHAGNLLDGAGDLRRPGVQQFRILAEQLDDHGFGRAGEIADHVLQELREFHVEHGFRLFDFGAHGGDDFLAAAFAVALQFDGDIAGVGFGHLGESQLQAGAARGALHFGRLAQNLFHVGDHAIGLFERRAGGHDVVDDEAAFVHRGQQIAAGVGIAEVAAADQGEGEDGQNQRVLQGGAQGALVDAHEAAGPGRWRGVSACG